MQNNLLRLIHGEAKHILAVGGARSGKTTGMVKEMVGVAYQYPGSRQLIARFRFKHVKTTIWNDTLKKVLSEYDKSTYTLNNTDLVVRFFNGSEIMLSGLDTQERIDNILGSEFCRIFLNECSQISYRAVTTAQTRLAQVIPGLQNKMFYDLNPTSLKHWTYLLFMQGINPDNKEPVNNAADYMHIYINPIDNKENLSQDYFDMLDSLPETERKRFKDGLYQKITGGIYNKFNNERHTGEPPLCETYAVGVDLITYAAVLIGFTGEKVYCVDECGDDDENDKLTGEEMDNLIEKKWGDYSPVRYIDHNLGKEGTRVFRNSVLADKGPGSVEFGINFIKQLMENDNLFISNKCIRLKYDIENYRRNPETGQIISKGNHFGDAFRYGVTSHGKNIIKNISNTIKAGDAYKGFSY